MNFDLREMRNGMLVSPFYRYGIVALLWYSQHIQIVNEFKLKQIYIRIVWLAFAKNQIFPEYILSVNSYIYTRIWIKCNSIRLREQIWKQECFVNISNDTIQRHEHVKYYTDIFVLPFTIIIKFTLILLNIPRSKCTWSISRCNARRFVGKTTIVAVLLFLWPLCPAMLLVSFRPIVIRILQRLHKFNVTLFVYMRTSGVCSSQSPSP